MNTRAGAADPQALEHNPPTLADVLAARRHIAPHLRPTPLYLYPGLSRLVGAEVWVKHENHQPTGAFKVRGGVNLVAQLGPRERGRGLICASTGNHGLSVAYAARLFGARALVCVPRDANPVKLEAIRDCGAEVVVHGRDFDEAREHCEDLAAAEGYRYVHSANEPLLIAGVGTCTLEILEEHPAPDAILVPVGGGSGAAAACIVAKALNPAIRVIGVQAEAAPAAYRSWRAGRLLEDRTATAAEGLATRVAFELPQRVLRELLDDFLLVGERELRRSVVWMLEKTRNLVEPAGAAPLAAALRLAGGLAGARVALVCTGGNIDPRRLGELLLDVDSDADPSRRGRGNLEPSARY